MLSRLSSTALRSRGVAKTTSTVTRAFASSQDPSEFKDARSFVRGVFSGKLETELCAPYPNVLDEEQQETLTMLLDPVSKFFTEVNDPAANDANSSVPDDISDAMKEMGLFGLQVPESHGGIGLNNTGYARLGEVMGANDLGIGIYLGAHQSIGFKAILILGNEEQKAKYLPKVASGEWVAAFSLTEPSVGSDANSVKCRAELNEEGTHYILNGSKLWISNGGIAEVFTVFAQTPVTDPKTGETKDKVTAFIVERGFGGVTNGPPENKMGIKCSNTAEVYFENTPIPVENVVDEAGKGFKVAMQVLNNGRFGMGAALSGSMKDVMALTIEQANTRTQFGNKLASYGMIQEKFAQMALKLYATESMAYMVAANMDRGAEDYQLEAAISKIYASEAAWDVTDECIQIWGGNGFMKDFKFERVLRDLRIFRIFEGTNEILRLFVALNGMQSAGKDLSGLQKALSNPLSNFGAISEAVSTRVSRVTGVGGQKLQGVHPDLAASAAQIEASVSAFSGAVEKLLVTHKKDIINQQIPLRRSAECAIELYAMMACVSRATAALSEGKEGAAHEKLLAETYCTQASEKIEGLVSQLNNPTTDEQSKQLANELLGNGNYIPSHPIGF